MSDPKQSTCGVPWNRWRAANPVCPYCGHVNSDGFEIAIEGEGKHETECPECEKGYTVEVFWNATFTSREKPQ